MQKANSRKKPAAPTLERFKAEIEDLAGKIFMKRQEIKAPGDALSDWLEAEKAVKGKYRFP
jgi:hypothetical protein